MSALGLLVAAVSIQQPAPLAPATRWSVDHADANCTLSRTFGSAGDRIVLGLIATPGRRFIDIVIAEPGANGPGFSRVKVTIAPASAKPIELIDAPSAELKEGGRATRTYITREQAAALRDAASVQIVVDGRSRDLLLSGMVSAFNALDRCEDDLVRQWGHDPVSIAKATTPPQPQGSPASWVTDNDYPRGALRRGEQGAVMFRLSIDATGRTRSCAVVASSGFKELDDAVCANMLVRTRFKPARDASGRAVPSLFVSRFTWRIPR